MRPGADHIMLIGLKRKLRKGETFPPTLEFAKLGKLTFSVLVMSIAASGMEHSNDDAKKEMKYSH